MNGPARAALFDYPQGVALTSLGPYPVLAVTELGNEDVRLVNESMMFGAFVTTLTGGQGAQISGYAEGDGSTATFSKPYGIVVDPNATNTYYIADSGNNKVRVVTGGVTGTLAGGGGTNQPGNVPLAYASSSSASSARFREPKGIAIPASGGYVILADTKNSKIRRIDLGSGIVSTIAGTGGNSLRNGPGSSATFTTPVGVAIAVSGDIYVADTGNSVIRLIQATGVDIGGATIYTVSTLVDRGSFIQPEGVSLGDGPSYILVTDTGNNRIVIVRLADSAILQVAGPAPPSSGPPVFGAADGFGPLATFFKPQGIVMDAPTGFIYVAGECFAAGA